MKLAIDFDGTIHDPTNVKKGYKMGGMIPGAATSIDILRKQGHEIIIFPTWATTQERRKALVDWLTYFGVPFDDITSVKPEAGLYIDNNAIRFESWEQAMRDVERYS